MRRLGVRLLICALLAAASPAAAGLQPVPAGGDPRLRVVGYDPLQVVEIRAVLGYQMMIEFDPAERIENVAIGDSLGWQVVPSRKANLLFVKPMDRVAPTNMTVVTNLRRYSFALSVRPGPVRPNDPDVIYSLRFAYPAPAEPVVTAAAPAPEPPQDVNHAYSYAGSLQNLPQRIFDDGHATYFRFAADASYPAIFAVEADHTEAVVNFHVTDGYIVVDRLAPGFVLRRGKEETRIFNDGFKQAGPSPLIPHSRAAKGRP
jgi:type IV secretion system protein VirB9